MKNSLYMTTAIAVAAAGVLAFGANDAVAAEKAKKMSIGVSGFMVSKVGYAKQEGTFEGTSGSSAGTGYDTFDIQNDSEVHFKGTTKLDNGISVSVVIELETDQAQAGVIDASYLKLTGGFGDVRIGSYVHASAVLSHKAPGAGALNYFGGDTKVWIHKPSAVSVSANAGVDIGGGDTMKIVYLTPRYSGFGLGVSYQPSSTSVDTMPATGGNGGTDTQTFNLAAVYEAKVGSADVKADVGYWEDNGTDANSAEAYQLGVNVTFGAITVGGQYMDKASKDSVTGRSSSSLDEEAYAFGVGYTAGPLKLAANYFNAEKPLSTATAGSDEVTKLTLGATYTMGPGVDLLGSIQHVKWEDESETGTSNNKGVAVVGGVKVTF